MLASAFCQYFAQLAYSSLYYGVVCQRSSGKSTQKAKLTKQQNGKNSAGLKGKKCAMPKVRLAKRKIHAKGKKGKKSARNV